MVLVSMCVGCLRQCLPPDLPSIAFGAATTLGYTENNTNTGGTLIISALTLPLLLFSATTLRGALSRRPTVTAGG